LAAAAKPNEATLIPMATRNFEILTTVESFIIQKENEF
jgi:hypothetical protein